MNWPSPPTGLSAERDTGGPTETTWAEWLDVLGLPATLKQGESMADWAVRMQRETTEAA